MRVWVWVLGLRVEGVGRGVDAHRVARRLDTPWPSRCACPWDDRSPRRTWLRVQGLVLNIQGLGIRVQGLRV